MSEKFRNVCFALYAFSFIGNILTIIGLIGSIDRGYSWDGCWFVILFCCVSIVVSSLAIYGVDKIYFSSKNGKEG